MTQHTFIKHLREDAGFSQEKMAGELGMSRVSYMAVEKGDKDITLSQAEILSRMFGVSLDELQGGKRINISKAAIKDIEDSKENIGKEEPKERIILPRENVKKFKEVLLYILEKVGSKPNVGMTVLYKLLYFIDFDYYEKYEEQLIGARYMKNTHGPTPTTFTKIVENMKEKKEIEEIDSKYFQYDQKKFLPLRPADLSVLSGQEKELIDGVLARLSDKSGSELSKYSHNDVPWVVAKDGQIISYESVFYRSDEYSVRQYNDEL
jgi:transcriptional regulator with XRE-family HTH domain